MDASLEQIQRAGLVPVVVIEDPDDAPALVGALVEGGLPVAEITFRTAAAEDAIRAATEAYPDVLIGAGSVLVPAQVGRRSRRGRPFRRQSRSRGGRREADPGGWRPGHARLCHAQRPDASTGSRSRRGQVLPGRAQRRAGHDQGHRRAVPRHALRADRRYQHRQPRGLPRSIRKSSAVGGSWMVKKSLVAAKDWPAITDATQEAVAAVKRAQERPRLSLRRCRRPLG